MFTTSGFDVSIFSHSQPDDVFTLPLNLVSISFQFENLPLIDALPEVYVNSSSLFALPYSLKYLYLILNLIIFCSPDDELILESGISQKPRIRYFGIATLPD